MIIPLEKLNALTVNKFEFTKAAMSAVSKLENIRDYPEPDHNWKIVPNILKLVLDNNIKYELDKFKETELGQTEESD